MSGVIHDNPKQVVTLLCTKNNLCHGLTISVLDATKLYHLDQPYGFIRNKLQYLESLLHKKMAESQSDTTGFPLTHYFIEKLAEQK